MSQLKITIEINTTAEIDALESALELFAESEAERLKDEERSEPRGTALTAYHRDRVRQQGAARLLKAIRGER